MKTQLGNGWFAVLLVLAFFSRGDGCEGKSGDKLPGTENLGGGGDTSIGNSDDWNELCDQFCARLGECGLDPPGFHVGTFECAYQCKDETVGFVDCVTAPNHGCESVAKCFDDRGLADPCDCVGEFCAWHLMDIVCEGGVSDTVSTPPTEDTLAPPPQDTKPEDCSQEGVMDGLCEGWNQVDYAGVIDDEICGEHCFASQPPQAFMIVSENIWCGGENHCVCCYSWKD